MSAMTDRASLLLFELTAWWLTFGEGPKGQCVEIMHGRQLTANRLRRLRSTQGLPSSMPHDVIVSSFFGSTANRR